MTGRLLLAGTLGMVVLAGCVTIHVSPPPDASGGMVGIASLSASDELDQVLKAPSLPLRHLSVGPFTWKGNFEAPATPYKETRLLRTAEEYAAYFAEQQGKTKLPDVDFAREMIIFAIFPTQESGSNHTELAAVVEDAEKLTVRGIVWKPGPGESGTANVVVRYDMVVVPKSDKRVEFAPVIGAWHQQRPAHWPPVSGGIVHPKPPAGPSPTPTPSPTPKPVPTGISTPVPTPTPSPTPTPYASPESLPFEPLASYVGNVIDGPVDNRGYIVAALCPDWQSAAEAIESASGGNEVTIDSFKAMVGTADARRVDYKTQQCLLLTALWKDKRYAQIDLLAVERVGNGARIRPVIWADDRAGSTAYTSVCSMFAVPRFEGPVTIEPPVVMTKPGLGRP